MNYKRQEEILATIIQVYSLSKCELVDDPYSHHDAETERSVLEFKVRDKYYETKMLEEIKFNKNLETAEKLNKAFLYVVWDPKGVWVLNVSKYQQKLREIGLTSKPMPASTHFERKEKVFKNFYLIPEEYLVKITE